MGNDNGGQISTDATKQVLDNATFDNKSHEENIYVGKPVIDHPMTYKMILK